MNNTNSPKLVCTVAGISHQPVTVDAVRAVLEKLGHRPDPTQHPGRCAGCALLASLPDSGVIVTAEQAAFAEAWDACEAECPDGYHVLLRPNGKGRWGASVMNPHRKWRSTITGAAGSTPTAALTALAEKLESANSESSCGEGMQ